MRKITSSLAGLALLVAVLAVAASAQNPIPVTPQPYPPAPPVPNFYYGPTVEGVFPYVAGLTPYSAETNNMSLEDICGPWCFSGQANGCRSPMPSASSECRDLSNVFRVPPRTRGRGHVPSPITRPHLPAPTPAPFDTGQRKFPGGFRQGCRMGGPAWAHSECATPGCGPREPFQGLCRSRSQTRSKEVDV